MKVRGFLVAQWWKIHMPMRRHGFDAWSRRIPRDAEQQSICTITKNKNKILKRWNWGLWIRSQEIPLADLYLMWPKTVLLDSSGLNFHSWNEGFELNQDLRAGSWPNWLSECIIGPSEHHKLLLLWEAFGRGLCALLPPNPHHPYPYHSSLFALWTFVFEGHLKKKNVSNISFFVVQSLNSQCAKVFLIDFGG